MRKLGGLTFVYAILLSCLAPSRESEPLSCSYAEAMEQIPLLLERQGFMVIQCDKEQGVIETKWNTTRSATYRLDRRVKVRLQVRQLPQQKIVVEAYAPMETASEGTERWSSSGRDEILEERILYLIKLKWQRSGL